MPDCQLRPATADDVQSVYALICELKQAEFDHQAFHAGYLANLQDHNMRYQLAELDGQRDLEEISQLLAARYDAPIEMVSADIAEFLDGLVARRLVDLT